MADFGRIILMEKTIEIIFTVCGETAARKKSVNCTDVALSDVLDEDEVKTGQRRGVCILG